MSLVYDDRGHLVYAQVRIYLVTNNHNYSKELHHIHKEWEK